MPFVPDKRKPTNLPNTHYTETVRTFTGAKGTEIGTCGAATWVGVTIPSEFTSTGGTGYSIRSCSSAESGATEVPLVTSTGGSSFDGAQASRYLALDPALTAGIRHPKILWDSAQTETITFEFHYKDLK